MTSKQEGEGKGKGREEAAGDHPNADDDNVHPLTNFVTTSYVIDSINSALEDVMKQEENDDGDGDSMPSSSSAAAATAEGSNGKRAPKSYFELQKRMPDGSTRKATEEEMSSQDMKNKLEQAAQLTSKMDLEEKLHWANKQRQQGNALYQEGRYKESIDIYLTCLVVRDTAKEKLNDEQEVLILPVMNNLAQCALQLGWWYKAEVFCTLAMESLDVNATGKAVAKLYFKRGKARRLRGWYDQAKEDLDKAMEKLPTVVVGATPTGDEEAEEDTTTTPTTTNMNSKDQKSPEQKAIEREYQLLAKAVAEGKKNKKRAQRAMQKVLGSSSTPPTATPFSPSPSSSDPRKETLGTPDEIEASSINKSTNTKAKATSRGGNDGNNNDDDEIPATTPLYHEKHGRTHSTIRKRPEGPPPYDLPQHPPRRELNYWQMYRLVIARVAQRLLDFIGEEEGGGFGGGGGGDDGGGSSPAAATTTGQRDEGRDGNTRVKQD